MSIPDFGENQLHALNAIVQARRQQPAETNLWERTRHFFGKKELPQLLGTSLTTLKVQGFIPQDFIEHEIQWKDMPYSIDASIAFGFTFEHMLTMAFQPDHFKQLEWRHYKQLKLNADEMMKTGLTIHDLNALKLTPQQLHQLKWSWTQLRSIGGTRENITIDQNDRELYFKHTETKPKQMGGFKF